MMEKKKRRSSQVFQFEQTEEALEENERLKELYQNKNFVSPEPIQLETIIEEGGKEEHRARRGAPSVSSDGGMVLGVGKGRRIIEGYKFWKQDDKERNKKRKAMMSKQWRGRKKPKVIFLDSDGEQKLQVMIDTREESEDDDDDKEMRDLECQQRLHGGMSEKGGSQIVCVWGKGKEGSESSVDDGEGCVWDSAQALFLREEIIEKAEPYKKNSIIRRNNSRSKTVNENKTVSGTKGKSLKKSVIDVENLDTPVIVVTEEPLDAPTHVDDKLGTNFNESVVAKENSRIETVGSKEASMCTVSEVSMATLCSIIPEGELAELLETEELLFCGSKKVAEEIPSRRGKESMRRSVRKSARLQHTPFIMGSVFTEEEVTMERNMVENDLHVPVSNISVIEEEEEDGVRLNLDMEGMMNSSLTVGKSTFEDFVTKVSFVNEEEDVDKIFLNDDLGKERLQAPSLANLTISEVPMPEMMTPPLLSANSKETFFNQIPRLEVAKKGKTKRRVPQGDKTAETENMNSNCTDAVLRDLSNLSLKSIEVKNSKNTNLKDPVIKKVKDDSKTKTEGKARRVKVSKAGVGRRKKAVCPSPDTTDEGFCFSGNLVSCVGEEAGKRRRRRESLRSAGRKKRFEVNYCEESERSGTMSKNSSLERSKRNSLLVISGEKEIDISMPAAVRRSLTGEFVPRLNRPSSTEPVLEVGMEVRSASSVGDAFMSDSEEEEIISGIFGKKTLAPLQQKEKRKIDRAFIK